MNMTRYKKELVDGLVHYDLPSIEGKRLYESRWHSGVFKKTGEEYDVWLNMFARDNGFYSAVDMLYYNEITNNSLIKFNDYCWTKDSYYSNNKLYLNNIDYTLDIGIEKEDDSEDEY